MIKNFEEITKELSWYESAVLLPLFIRGLKNKIGKENAVTSTEIVRNLKSKGYKLNGVRVRKLIHHIRVNHLIPRLIATSKGYYVSNDKEEIEAFILSLEQRISSIKEIKNALYSDNVNMGNEIRRKIF